MLYIIIIIIRLNVTVKLKLSIISIYIQCHSEISNINNPTSNSFIKTQNNA
jgi:hypothetical protein